MRAREEKRKSIGRSKRNKGLYYLTFFAAFVIAFILFSIIFLSVLSAFSDKPRVRGLFQSIVELDVPFFKAFVITGKQVGGEGISVSATTINLNVSRTSCVAPCAVFFDSTGTTSTSTNMPFHELDYTWDFGDASSGVWATSGKPKNIAKGGVAAHVFESAGTYNVRLDVKDASGTTATQQVAMTIQDPDVVFSGTNTICFSTGNDFTGCPSGAQQVTTSSFITITSYVATNRRLLLKRGDIWTYGGDASINAQGPGILGAFGTCIGPDARGICSNSPKIVVTGTNGKGIAIGGGIKDWRVMDLEIQGTASSSGSEHNGIEFSTGSTGGNNLAYRMNVYDFRVNVNVPWTSWGSSENFLADSKITEGQINNVYFAGFNFAILGNAINRNPVSHLLRIFTGQKGVISNNELLDPSYNNGAGRLSLKLHNDRDLNAMPEARYFVISDNKMRASGYVASMGPQDSLVANTEQVRDIIFERNILYGQHYSAGGDFGTSVFIVSQGRDVSIRNNIINEYQNAGEWVGHGISIGQGVSPLPPRTWIYNNVIYAIDPFRKEFTAVVLNGGENYVKNNIFYSVATSSNEPTLFIANYAGTNEISNNIGYFPNRQSDCVDVNGNQGSAYCNDPLFTDPNNDNFNLQAGSPAIDAGTSVPVFDDYAGNARPQGTGWDIGAFEFVSAPAPPQCSDGTDNDGDGLVDLSDSGCVNNQDTREDVSLTPIARVDVVPRQRINAGDTFNFGVVAFSKYGIDRVEFAISGQGYSGGVKTATQMSYNDRTGVWEYWVPISASEFSLDGVITIDSTVYGNDGGIRGVNTEAGDGLDTITLIVNPLGTLPRPEAWVSLTGSDTTGQVGNRNQPFATIGGAANAIQNANGGRADGGIIRLMQGTYVNNGGGVASVLTQNEWVTVTNDPASGGNADNTIIDSRNSPTYTNYFKVDGITLKTYGQNQYVIETSNVGNLWVDNSKLIGPGRYFIGCTDSNGGLRPVRHSSAWMTNDYITEVDRAGTGNFARNLTIEKISEDAFQNVDFVVNTKVDDQDSGCTFMHADAIQHWGGGSNNAIVYNYRVTNSHYQGIFNRAQTPANNNAFVNVLIEMRKPGRDGTDNGISEERLAAGAFYGTWNHLILWNVNLLGAFSTFVYDSGDAQPLIISDSSFIGNVFFDFRCNNNQYCNLPGQEPPFGQPGNSYRTEFIHNHYNYSAVDTPACQCFGCCADTFYQSKSPDTEPGGVVSQSLWDPGIDLNPSSPTFGYPLASSVLIDRIDSLQFETVPIDALGNLRGSMADVGAFEFQGIPQCNDGIDNDGDGLVDWQYDLGCYGADDASEGGKNNVIENGWTVFDPSADTRIVYVSSSDGNDICSGLSSAPYSVSNPTNCPRQTIGAGLSLIRNGFPDWMLFKRGETWNTNFGTIGVSGRSQNERIVIGSYGANTNRPLFLTPQGSNGISFADGVANVALLGLSLTPASRADGDTNKGINIEGVSVSNLLVEDMEIKAYGIRGLVIAGGGTRSKNLTLRRNLFLDMYSTGGDSHGIFVNHVDGILIEENIFDHNGWNANVANTASFRNHDMYIQVQNGHPNCAMYLGCNTLVEVKGNIFSQSSTGVQMRVGGVAENNLFVREPYALVFGAVLGGAEFFPEREVGVSGRIVDNVFLEGVDIPQGVQPRGVGFGIANINKSIGLNVSRNIIAHELSDEGNSAGMEMEENNGPAPKLENVTIHDNVIYDWNRALRFTGLTGNMLDVKVENNQIQEAKGAIDCGEKNNILLLLDNSAYDPVVSGDIVFTNNVYDLTATANPGLSFNIDRVCHDFTWWKVNAEPTAAEQQITYPDPNRTVAEYRDSIEGLPAGTSTFNDFINEARSQSKFNWRTEYTTQAVNDYIRAGFGVGSPPSDATPPTRSNGSPSGALPAGTTSTTISLTTNEAATCKYSTLVGVVYASMTNTFSTTGGTSHSTLITGLSDGNNYNYYVRCQDLAGNANTNDFAISFSIAVPDTIPPNVSSVSAISQTGVRVIYSEAMNRTAIQTISNYLINNGISISGVSVSADNTTATLTTSSMTNGTTYTLTISNVRDRAGNLISPNPTNVNYIYQESVVPSGLSAHWKFDEGSGLTAFDSTGNGNNGTLISSPTRITGKINGALSFNGGNRVEVPSSSSLIIGNELTIAAWIVFDTLNPVSGFPMIVDSSLGTPRQGYSFFFRNSDNILKLELWNAGAIVGGVDGIKANWNINEWHHVAVVFSSTDKKIYVNGVLDSSTGFGSGLTNGIGTRLDIGRGIEGDLDEAMIFNRALTSQEVNDLYNSGGTSQPICTDNDFDGWNATSGGSCGSVADCDYNNATINPGAIEICGDNVDNNCNGLVDSADPACTLPSQHPTIAINYPLNGSTLSSGTFIVNYTKAGNQTNVNHTHLILDGIEYMDLDNDGSYQFNGIADGAHALRVFLVDLYHVQLGNDHNITFTITTPAPPPQETTTSGGGGGAPRVVAKPITNETILIPQIERIELLEGETSSVEIDKEEIIIIDVYGSSYELSFVITDDGVIVKSFSGDYLIPRNEVTPVAVGNREMFIGIERFEEDKASVVIGLDEGLISQQIEKWIEQERREKIRAGVFYFIIIVIVIVILILIVIASIIHLSRKREKS